MLATQGWATAALLVVVVWKYFGFHMALFVAGRQGIGDEVLEAAKIDGANLWQTTLNIVLPLMRPGGSAIALLQHPGFPVETGERVSACPPSQALRMTCDSLLRTGTHSTFQMYDGTRKVLRIDRWLSCVSGRVDRALREEATLETEFVAQSPCGLNPQLGSRRGSKALEDLGPAPDNADYR